MDLKKDRCIFLGYLGACSKIGGVAANLLQDKLLFDFIITMR